MMHPSIYTKLTEKKGWGVFTKHAIKNNTIIEISPVVVMTVSEKKLLDKTKLHDYIFFWERDSCCMALGNISIYNHSYNSNCEYFQDYENNTIFIKTIREILEEEELTINYNGDFDDTKEIWFDAV